MLIDLASRGSQAEIATIVGVTQQNISALMAEGKLPVMCALGDMVLSYCQRLRDQAAGRLGAEIGGLDLVQERAALAREQRLGIEIKNATARGEYASIALLAEVLAIASQSVSERFEQLPGALKKACPDLPDAARETIMTVIAGARNEWVRATEKLVVQRLDEDDQDDEVADA